MQFLENKHIVLRALEPEDLDSLFDVENDRSLWQVSNTLAPFSRHLLEQYISKAHQDIFEARQLRLAISPKNNKLLLGLIDLFDFDPQHRRAGIGIVILKEHQNNGFASQALGLMRDYAFDHLDLHQVFAHIPSNNGQSRRLFERAGFEHAGTQRDWIRSGREFLDVELYQSINN
jgi:diamine N-acetyltransferase